MARAKPAKRAPPRKVAARTPTRAVNLHEAWAKRHSVLKGQIEALEPMRVIHGNAWVDGQQRYWRKLLAELEANKPT